MANAYQTMDTDLTLLQNDAGGELSWHRAYGGARVSCALADVLAVNAQGSALYVHHYPLVQVSARVQARQHDVCGGNCVVPRAPACRTLR